MNKTPLTILRELVEQLDNNGIPEHCRGCGVELDFTEARDLIKANARESVWVLVISHRHGNDITVHRTKEEADGALYLYCVQWWDEYMVNANGSVKKMPKNPDVVVERYFEAAEGESYECEEHPL
jgi:hypothetical protein